jgi:predicted metal-binding protein
MAGRFGKYGDAKRKAHLRRKGKTGDTMPKTKEDRRQHSSKKNRKDLEENRMGAKSDITENEREGLDRMFQEKGYADYKWINPQKIIVSQWVRMKCMFGCGEYGKNACCPPNVPSVSECERFFHEYQDAVIFRFEKAFDKPEDRHKWSKKVNIRLAKLERDVFLAGYERAFLLFMDSCCICGDCTATREGCKEPRSARPSPESLAVDVYSTAGQFGFPIEVRTEYSQEMNRYAFLMIR